MTWGERPRSRIPQRIRDQVRRRDKTCRLGYDGCTGRIDEMDHIEGLAAQGRPRETVLCADEIQGVCAPCHKVKTQRQSAEGRARAAARRGSGSRRYRDRESHPGRL